MSLIRFKIKDLEVVYRIEKENILVLANFFNSLKKVWGKNNVSMEFINE